MAPKVHRPQGPAGGDKLIVESGGEIEVKSGGVITIEAGGSIVAASTDNLTVTSPDDATIENSSENTLRVKDDGLLGDKVKGTTALDGQQNVPIILELPVLAHSTDGATAGSVELAAPRKLTIIDVLARKTGAGSSGTTVLTVQLATSTDGAISDAIDMKGVLGKVGRAATLVPSLAERAAGAIIKATRAGSSGTSNAGMNTEITVRVVALARATTA